jgi:hypothetical protein
LLLVMLDPHSAVVTWQLDESQSLSESGTARAMCADRWCLTEPADAVAVHSYTPATFLL